MKFITSLFAMFVCGIALAQDTAPVEPTAPVAPVPVVEPAPAPAPVVEASPALPACQEKKFSVNFATSTTLYDFDEGNITEIDTELVFDVSDRLKVGVGLPFYNDSNDYFNAQELTWQLDQGIFGRSGTGLGDLDIFGIVNLIDGKCEYLKNDHVWFDLTGGVKVPFDGTYASGDNIPHFGAEIGGAWGPLTLSYGFSYEFVDEYTFVSPLGGFIDSDVYEGIATLGWKASDDFSVHLKATQYHWDAKDLFLLGPGFEYALTDNLSFGADIAVPTNDDTPGGNLDISLSAGVGFQF